MWPTARPLCRYRSWYRAGRSAPGDPGPGTDGNDDDDDGIGWSWIGGKEKGKILGMRGQDIRYA